MNFVFDTSAKIAYLRNEPGRPVVESILADRANTCYAHAINLIEVYYDFIRWANEAAARTAMQDLVAAGVIIREDLDSAFCEEVARLKAPRRLPLADCICIALARRVNGEVVTSDHHDYDPLVPQGLCTVRFIR